ncbi:Gfo/Idh/MocA family oxidoreductase [Streptomyces sp. MST-110588]|uniref:Gfo/Idh/MocA family protein n=1 Tax=Streptomyces sp. MST-110588 TaxID=2833628 RepID=UPI001F5C8CE9|nr:Gfo/Idh/MocA family oxidoreductase [Streptomyces sp. MST-110588]UNO41845.1 Gfo/Idh/MocA family oxidoreductase [Streptomyces sp. MST-110588]
MSDSPGLPGSPAATHRPLRVGLIGYGLAGSVFHAPLIAATDGLVLDTVSTGNPERQAQARAEHPQVRTADSAEALLARAADLDLVVIASPNKTHVALATAALEAGLPVVVDKPLAATAAEAEHLAALADSRGLLLSVFHNRRWDNDFRTVRKLLADGALGTVQRFESRFERWRPRPKGGWRESGDPAEIGGLLYDLGSHVADQALTLFGPAASVYAESDVRRPGAEADDDTFIAITHTGGVRSHLWVSATTAQLGPRFRVLGSSAGYVKYGLDPQEAALRAGLRPGADRDDWGVEPESAWGWIGAGGTTQDAAQGGGTSQGAGGAAAEPEGVRPVPTLPGDYPAYYAAVAEALRTGGRPPVTATEAAATLRVLEAAKISAAEGRTVRIEEVTAA